MKVPKKGQRVHALINGRWVRGVIMNTPTFSVKVKVDGEVVIVPPSAVKLRKPRTNHRWDQE